MKEQKNTTDFGFSEIPIEEKSQRVSDIFQSVANQYDLMNDVMSAGLHRLWKRFTISQSGVRRGYKILDIAGGTGDLAAALAKKTGETGQVILTDINNAMLCVGRDRLFDKGIVSQVKYVQADAEALPFADNYFNCITLAFGLRNMTNKKSALCELYRVLKPGGKCLVLEFSKPILPFLKSIYDAYSFKIIPKLGGLITGDEKSYQYLVESIRMHPDQMALKRLFEESGFEDVNYFNLSGGITALHSGFKY